jgi:RNA polymerase sigma-70 factor (ECF subfamily)
VSAQVLPFDVIHAQLQGFVRRTLASVGIRAAEVDDVAQEVFVLLHRKGGVFHDLAAARSWLYRASRRLASNHLRGTRRSEARQPGWSPAESNDLEAQVQARRTLEQVAQTARLMDAAATSAFVMVELEGRCPAQAAAALGIKVNTTRSHVQRVRARLRQAVVLALVIALAMLLTGQCSTEAAVVEVRDDSIRRSAELAPRPTDDRTASAEHLWGARRHGDRARQSPRLALRASPRARAS